MTNETRDFFWKTMSYVLKIEDYPDHPVNFLLDLNEEYDGDIIDFREVLLTKEMLYEKFKDSYTIENIDIMIEDMFDSHRVIKKDNGFVLNLPGGWLGP